MAESLPKDVSLPHDDNPTVNYMSVFLDAMLTDIPSFDNHEIQNELHALLRRCQDLVQETEYLSMTFHTIFPSQEATSQAISLLNSHHEQLHHHKTHSHAHNRRLIHPLVTTDSKSTPHIIIDVDQNTAIESLFRSELPLVITSHPSTISPSDSTITTHIDNRHVTPDISAINNPLYYTLVTGLVDILRASRRIRYDQFVTLLESWEITAITLVKTLKQVQLEIHRGIHPFQTCILNHKVMLQNDINALQQSLTMCIEQYQHHQQFEQHFIEIQKKDFNDTTQQVSSYYKPNSSSQTVILPTPPNDILNDDSVFLCPTEATTATTVAKPQPQDPENKQPPHLESISTDVSQATTTTPPQPQSTPLQDTPQPTVQVQLDDTQIPTALSTQLERPAPSPRKRGGRFLILPQTTKNATTTITTTATTPITETPTSSLPTPVPTSMQNRSVQNVIPPKTLSLHFSNQDLDNNSTIDSLSCINLDTTLRSQSLFDLPLHLIRSITSYLTITDIESLQQVNYAYYKLFSNPLVISSQLQVLTTTTAKSLDQKRAELDMVESLLIHGTQLDIFMPQSTLQPYLDQARAAAAAAAAAAATSASATAAAGANEGDTATSNSWGQMFGGVLNTTLASLSSAATGVTNESTFASTTPTTTSTTTTTTTTTSTSSSSSEIHSPSSPNTIWMDVVFAYCREQLLRRVSQSELSRDELGDKIAAMKPLVDLLIRQTDEARVIYGKKQQLYEHLKTTGQELITQKNQLIADASNYEVSTTTLRQTLQHSEVTHSTSYRSLQQRIQVLADFQSATGGFDDQNNNNNNNNQQLSSKQHKTSNDLSFTSEEQRIVTQLKHEKINLIRQVKQLRQQQSTLHKQSIALCQDVSMKHLSITDINCLSSTARAIVYEKRKINPSANNNNNNNIIPCTIRLPTYEEFIARKDDPNFIWDIKQFITPI